MNKLEKSLYNQLYNLSKNDHQVKAVSKKKMSQERRNSAKSRGHRLEHFLKTSHKAIVAPAKQITCRERIRAIKGMLSVYEQGFITEENLLLVLSDIVKGE